MVNIYVNVGNAKQDNSPALGIDWDCRSFVDHNDVLIYESTNLNNFPISYNQSFIDIRNYLTVSLSN